MKGAVKTLFFLSMLMVTSAQAKIYMCKDASGKTPVSYTHLTLPTTPYV